MSDTTSIAYQIGTTTERLIAKLCFIQPNVVVQKYFFTVDTYAYEIMADQQLIGMIWQESPNTYGARCVYIDRPISCIFNTIEEAVKFIIKHRYYL